MCLRSCCTRLVGGAQGHDLPFFEVRPVGEAKDLAFVILVVLQLFRHVERRVPPWQCRGRPWQCCGRPCERAACALARRSGSRARLRARVDKYPTPARASDNLIVGGGEGNLEQDRESGAAVRMFACRRIRVSVGWWVRGTRWRVLCSCRGVLCI